MEIICTCNIIYRRDDTVPVLQPLQYCNGTSIATVLADPFLPFPILLLSIELEDPPPSVCAVHVPLCVYANVYVCAYLYTYLPPLCVSHTQGQTHWHKDTQRGSSGPLVVSTRL